MFRFKYTFAVALAFISPIVTSAQVSATVDAPASVRPGDEFRVSITVNKSGIDGFAKLEHKMSSDFMVAEEELAASTFKYSDGKVKYLWMALPSTDAFTVSYLVTAAANMSGAQILEGTFSYVQNNDTKKYQLPKTILMVSKDASEQQSVSSSRTERSSDKAQLSDVPTNYNKAEPKRTQDYIRDETSVTEAYTETDGLIYRVQILAGRDMRNAEAVAAAYGIAEQVTVTEHDGMYKYVVGEFSMYQSAKTLSNELRNTTTLPGPFVVAYQDGYRISTAEALQHLTDNLSKVEQQIQSRTQQFSN